LSDTLLKKYSPEKKKALQALYFLF